MESALLHRSFTNSYQNNKFNKFILFCSIIAFPFFSTIFISKVKTAVLFFLALSIIFNGFSVATVKNYISKPLALFFISAVVSSFIARNFDLAQLQLLDYLIDFLFAMAISNMALKTKNSLDVIWMALAIGLIISVLIGYMQFTGNRKFYIYDTDDLNPNTNTDDALESVRAWGPFGNSLTFSNYLSVVGILISLYCLIKPLKWYRLYSYIICFLVTIGLIISGGRTASVTFIMAYFAGYFILSKRGKSKIIFSIALVFLILLFLNGVSTLSIYSRFLDSNDDFKEGRLAKWYNAMDIFSNNPILGVGPGNLNIALRKYNTSDISGESLNTVGGHVESVYLTIMATYGLLGLFCFFNLILKSIKRTAFLLKQFKVYNYYSFPLLIAWIVMTINMVTNPALIVDNRITILFLLLLMFPVLLNSEAKKGLSEHV